MEVDPGNGGGGDGIECTGEWGVGAVVKNVEATDAVVVIIVSEEFREIHGLVLHCEVHLVLFWIGFCERVPGTHLPCKSPCTLRYRVAQA